jgi:ADP-ribosylation factor GTPase-activating protein 2/3
VQPRKPAGKLGGGLGVKKLDTKVDGTLFEQAPAAPEPVAIAPVAAAAAASPEPASSGPSASSRFAYDSLATPAAPTPGSSSSSAAPQARGKDGHLTLGLSNDDFFKDPLRQQPGGLSGKQGSGQFGGFGGGGRGGGAPEVEPLAQKRFANAKAISSRWVVCVVAAAGRSGGGCAAQWVGSSLRGGPASPHRGLVDTPNSHMFTPHRDFQNNAGENDMERQTRLSRFDGATAISSDAYFNRADSSGMGGGGGGPSGGGGMGGGGGSGNYTGADMDLTAAELVNRLSFHVSRAEWVVALAVSGVPASSLAR